MALAVTPHLNFRGAAREALQFYRSVFGGELTIVTHGDTGAVTGDGADRVSWGQVASADGFRVMAYDVYPQLPWEPGQHAFYVSLRGDDEQELRQRWEALAVDATIIQPLGPSAWAPLYGMLTDRFGVTWVLDIAVAYSAA